MKTETPRKVSTYNFCIFNLGDLSSNLKFKPAVRSSLHFFSRLLMKKIKLKLKFNRNNCDKVNR